MKSFEYEDTRFTKKPVLQTDRANREIHLSTLNEHFTLRLSKEETNGGQFTILANALIGLMPNVEAVVSTMRDMCGHMPNAMLLCDVKQGAVWNDDKEFIFRDDPWKDGLTFEEWCSVEQIAKEFYRRKNNKPSKNDGIINVKDLLNGLI